MCRPPRIPLNADERTARRSVPATFVGCVLLLAAKKHNGRSCEVRAVQFLNLALFLALKPLPRC